MKSATRKCARCLKPVKLPHGRAWCDECIRVTAEAYWRKRGYDFLIKRKP